MGLDLLRDQVALSDLDLLLLGVAGQADHLEAVLQGLGDGVQDVRGGDEEDRREVVLHVEVVVGEGVVLLRVQDLEEGGGGVAPEVHGHLVHLVEEEDGVARARLLHHLDDLPGEGADVGPPVAPDLGLVPHPAQREPHELAVGAARDRAGERGLAHPGRSHEAEDGALRVVDQLAHGQELDDALLHLLEAVVVLVQDDLGRLEVLPLAGLLRPGDGDQPVEVVARDGRLRGHRGHRLQALELRERLLLRLLGHPRLLDLLAQLVRLAGAVLLAAELLLDRLHLLVEVVLLLGPLHLLLDPALDAAVDRELVDLGLEDGADAGEPLLRGEDLEEVLLLLHRDHEVGGDRVGELPRVLHPHRGEHGVVVEVVRELDVLLEEADDLRHQPFHPCRRLLGAGNELGHHLERAAFLAELEGAGAVEALHQHLDVAVGQLEALHDAAHGAEGVDLLGAGVVAGGVVLRGEEDALAAGERVIEGPDGALPPDDERDHHVREDHHVPQRDHGEGFDHVVLVTPEHCFAPPARGASDLAPRGASKVARPEKAP